MASTRRRRPPLKIFLYSYSTILYLYLKWPYRVCYSSL